MRTNIVLDDKLLEDAMKETGIRTKRAVVHEALKELINSRRRRNLLDLRGKIKFSQGFDHKRLRAEGHHSTFHHRLPHRPACS